MSDTNSTCTDLVPSISNNSSKQCTECVEYIRKKLIHGVVSKTEKVLSIKRPLLSNYVGKPIHNDTRQVIKKNTGKLVKSIKGGVFFSALCEFDP